MNNQLDYTLNITEFPSRNITKIWKPESITDLREIIVDASKEGTPIYPISTGHNWGLGSKLPVVDSDIIDLSSLNEIIEVNESLACARIQPGVTQIQLANFLKEHYSNLILNVTGSDAHSSILGNALERGSGKNGQRANDIRELSIMDGEGRQYTTGFGAMKSNHGSFYKYGLGPDLTHLFTQSNFGIVTEGVINLLPKQPFNLYLGTLSNESKETFLGSFSSLVRKGVIGHTLEIDSQNDPKIYELFETADYKNIHWVCWFAIYGNQDLLKAKDKTIQADLRGLTDLKRYGSEEDHSDAPVPVQVRISRYNGIPNDHSLISTAKAFGVDLPIENPDIDLYKILPGFRCVLPVIPFASEGAAILDLIFDYSRSTDFDPVMSVIALDTYSMEVFARVYFNRNSKHEVAMADGWSRGLAEVLEKNGIHPYRLDVDGMIPYLSNANDPWVGLKSIIKKYLDPQGIIAPGRYHLISDI